MEFYLILEEIMKEKGMNIPAVARACGLSDTTVRSIMARKQKNVALEVAFKLSQGLGVSLQRLNGMPEPPENKKNTPSVAETEPADDLRSVLIKNFDQLNQEGRERLVETSDDMVSSGKYIKSDEVPLTKAQGA